MVAAIKNITWPGKIFAMSTNEMKKAFVFKKLMSKKINKKTVASIGSRAVLALALAIECCEEIETSIEASEEIEDEEDCKKVEVKPIQGKITEIKKVLKLFSEEFSVKAIKKYLKKEKKIKDEEDPLLPFFKI